jgi:hypothetical protein
MHTVLSRAADCVFLIYFPGMFLRYILNYLGMVSFASVIAHMTSFALYMHCISVGKSCYIYRDDVSTLTCVIVLYPCFGVFLLLILFPLLFVLCQKSNSIN